MTETSVSASGAGVQEPPAQAPDAAGAGLRTRSARGVRGAFEVVDRAGPAGALVLLWVLLSVTNDTFGTFQNFMLIGLEAAPIGILAAGMSFVILSGGIDLSVGSLVGLTGVVAALLMSKGLFGLPVIGSYPAMGLALVLGALVGLYHGFMITRFKLQPFVITLGSLSILVGLSLVMTDSSPVNDLPDDFKWIANIYIYRVPFPLILMIAVYVVAWLVLTRTTFGRYVYAIGNNEGAARLAGIAVDRVKIYIYMISGFLAAVAGMLLMARTEAGIFSNGGGYELQVVSAVVIGGISLAGGTGVVWGSLVGALIMQTVQVALTLFSIPPNWTNVVTGVVLVLAVLLDQVRRRVRATAD